MDAIRNMSGKRDDLHGKILLLAVAVLGLMVLFPPKVVTTRNPIFDQSTTEAAGYQFLLSDPAGEKKAAARLVLGDEVDKFIGSGIDWGKLLIQLALTGGAAVFLLRSTKPKPY
jgi:hypothetical protein